MLSEAESIVSAASDQESDSQNRIPENLQGSERYEQSDRAVECLDEALDHIAEAKEQIESAIV